MDLTRRGFAMTTLAGASTLAFGIRQGRAQSWDPGLSDFDRFMGDPNAPVTIIEYSSFTCPHCARFHTDTLAQLVETYVETGQLRFVFRDFPLDGLALRAGALARCVDEEHFFGMVDVLFENQRQWATSGDPIAALAQIGRLAGVDQDAFDACMADEALLNQIIQLRVDAEEIYGVDSTPTFVLNGEIVRGALPFESFAELIDAALEA